MENRQYSFSNNLFGSIRVENYPTLHIFREHGRGASLRVRSFLSYFSAMTLVYNIMVKTIRPQRYQTTSHVRDVDYTMRYNQQ